jgi:O-glycosyl hydrolase
LIAAESFNFNRMMTDPILNDPLAREQVDIIGGHIYGNGLFEYPLARELGKEVWMTEHYTSSQIGADVWPDALAVAREIHDCMSASFSAYIWWYIRRSYGPLTENGLVSKRGQLLAQYSKFIRPGDVRVEATAPSNPDVLVTAYARRSGGVVLVAVNLSTEAQSVSVAVAGGCVDGFSAFTTSELDSVASAGHIDAVDGLLSLTLGPQSATTFVSD